MVVDVSFVLVMLKQTQTHTHREILHKQTFYTIITMSHSDTIQDFHKNLRNYFKDKTVKDLVGQQRDVVSFQPTQTIESCLKLFSKHSVRSAPLDSGDGIAVRADDSSVEFVDFVDIASFMVDFLSKHGGSGEEEETAALVGEDLFAEFMRTPVKEIANHAKLDRFEVISLDASAYDAAQKLVGNDSAATVKRILVVDADSSDKKVVNIVTLGDVLYLIKKYMDEKCSGEGENEKRQEQLRLTVSDLNLGGAMPEYVTEEQTALDAFRTMVKAKQSFVPIVSNEDGSLVSVISVRDIKILVSEMALEEYGNTFKALAMPVMDFVGLTRQSSPEDKYPYIFCKKSDTVETVVKRLRATHVHRLLLIDEGKIPTGVVNVHSVCRQIVLE